MIIATGVGVAQPSLPCTDIPSRGSRRESDGYWLRDVGSDRCQILEATSNQLDIGEAAIRRPRVRARAREWRVVGVGTGARDRERGHLRTGRHGDHDQRHQGHGRRVDPPPTAGALARLLDQCLDESLELVPIDGIARTRRARWGRDGHGFCAGDQARQQSFSQLRASLRCLLPSAFMT